MLDTKNRLNYAQEFARKAHKPFTEKSISGVIATQIHHIQEVADLVWISGGSEDETIAAWLHDVVEDTEVTIEDLEEEFGGNVSKIVAGLTDHTHYKDMLLPERKKLQAERLLNESVSVRRVKLADQLSNVRGLALDPIDDMTHQECHQYIYGAGLLAEGCKGISPLLDMLFETEYKKGIERFK